MGATPKQGPQHVLNFRVIERPLDALLEALGNKIEREWPSQFAQIVFSREFFLVTLRTAEVTYRTIRYFCAEIPNEPSRKLQYSIAVAPLNRTILDAIFTVVFLLEDLPSRCEWYNKAGWAEQKLELERYKQEYGGLPEWQGWLGRLEAVVNDGVGIFGISAEEANAPKKKIPRWPNPGKMPHYGMKPSAPLAGDRKFLQYLHDWFYRDMSSQIHLSGSGLMKRSGFLIRGFPLAESLHETLDKYRRDQVGTTIILVLALASEMEAHLRFGLNQQARYLWGILQNYSMVAKELYSYRYSALL